MAFKHMIRAVLIAGLVVLAFSAARAENPVKIVGFGDSLMAGYQLASDAAFPSRLEAALRDKGHDVTVVNAGVSGDTSSGGLARLDWSVPDDTDLVILELGANDALRGILPELTRDNLDKMISRLKERGIGVVLAGMLAPPNMGPDYETAFNAIYPDLAERHGVPLHPFFLDGVAANQQLLLADGMHPNPDGVDVMVTAILPLMETALKSGE